MLHISLPLLQKNVINSFPGWEIDIFLHTWRREEDGVGTWEFTERGPWHKTMYVYGHGTGLSILKPRSYFLENYEDRTDLKALPRAYSMFYSIQRANDARHDYEKLLEVQYDLVMRYRTDCVLNENLFSLLEPYLQEKKSFLCIPKAKQPKTYDGPVDSDEYGICDWFAIGTADAMDIYCGTYTTFQPLGVSFVPESMLALQLKIRGIGHTTILKRPLYDMYLVEGSGQIRGV